MEVDVRSEILDQYITILKGDYVPVDVRQKISKVIKYALNHDFVKNKKRAEKLTRILVRPTTIVPNLDLVHKAKCILLLEEIKIQTKELNDIQCKKIEEFKHEINIMEDYLRECGYVGIFEPYREPYRRIVTVNNLKSFKEKFLQNIKNTCDGPEENQVSYYFKIPSTWSPYSVFIEIREH